MFFINAGFLFHINICINNTRGNCSGSYSQCFTYEVFNSVIVVLLLLFLGMYYLQMGRHVNKINKALGKALIIILSVILGFGNWYLFSTGSAFSRMTSGKKMYLLFLLSL